VNKKHSRIQRKLTERLTTQNSSRSPRRVIDVIPSSKTSERSLSPPQGGVDWMKN